MIFRWWLPLVFFTVFSGDAMADNNLNNHLHEEVEQHEFSKDNRFNFEGEQYWYYNMLNQVSQESINNGMLFGEIQERDSKIYFQISTKEIDNVNKRNQGYTMAIAKIVAFLEPGYLTQNENNKAYMQRLKKILQQNTQLSDQIIDNHSRLSLWFSRNKARLQWSEKDRKLVVGELK
ncbi:hypothetical protein [Candidatus Colwellia aromaticivorans]|uniref:hypothetical protein n=1 Tax=Candidatus Colwellia aromaticivorans TaxID=2267621 RepID=UPI000DF21518|nr:hypothetical protein [Candidatus Colwellia aromaticivorans]